MDWNIPFGSGNSNLRLKQCSITGLAGPNNTICGSLMLFYNRTKNKAAGSFEPTVLYIIFNNFILLEKFLSYTCNTSATKPA